MLFRSVFASKAVNGAVGIEGIFISGEADLFVANLTGVLVVSFYSVLATYGIIKVVNLVTPVRVSHEEEEAGLDSAMHGEFALYNDRSHIKVG